MSRRGVVLGRQIRVVRRSDAKICDNEERYGLPDDAPVLTMQIRDVGATQAQLVPGTAHSCLDVLQHMN